MKFSKLRKFLVLFLIPLAFVVIFSGTGAVHATTVTPVPEQKRDRSTV